MALTGRQEFRAVIEWPKFTAKEDAIVPIACEGCGQMVRESVVTRTFDLSVWMIAMTGVKDVRPAEHDCREPVV